MIKAVIFDCFGVLYHGSLGHLRELMPQENWPQLADLRIASDRGYISNLEYLDGVAELTGLTRQQVIDIVQADHIRNQALFDYVATLHHHYKTALLSNVGLSVMEELFTPEELTSHFDAVVLSSDIGMVKPYPEIFRYTAHQLDMAPEACVMIDDLVQNIDGAEEAGMSGIVYTSQPQLKRGLQALGVEHA